jgi:hypothetical protein
MTTIATIVIAWTAAAMLLGLFVGAFIREGQR